MEFAPNSSSSSSTNSTNPSAADSDHLRQPSVKACAACKHQRRRCPPDCMLKPYFPSDQPELFANAHRFFGNSNLLKMITPFDGDQRSDVMSSIIFHSEARACDLAGGAPALALNLHMDNELLAANINRIRRDTELWRNRTPHCGDGSRGNSTTQLGFPLHPNILGSINNDNTGINANDLLNVCYSSFEPKEEENVMMEHVINQDFQGFANYDGSSL